MPFTPAHAAIVLPLLRGRYFSATALIIGCLAPDFEYFFKMSVHSEHSHTLAGIFYFDIPVTLLLSLVFHHAVKQNLISNLPVYFQLRFQDTLSFDFREYRINHYLIFLVSAGIGSASHIFWDAFTHEDGYFVRMLPVYDETVVPYNGARYPLFYALQHISTGVGLVAVIVYILLKKTQRAVVFKPQLRYWIVLVTVSLFVVAIRFTVKSSDYMIGNLVVSGISGLCLGLVLCGFVTFKNVSVESR